ncbi:MAG: reverse transcriptase family protein, partial [Myxococcota bacterium]
MKDEKKELYRQIVESTDTEMLLERMRELGFWPWGQEVPDDPDDEAKEWNELEYEIARLRKKAAVVADPQKALQKERVRRWNESKERRKKAKIARELEQKARREEWEAYKKDKIVTAGDGVSAGLQPKPGEGSWRFGVPAIGTPTELATAMGISITKLRWLTFHRRAAALVHYNRYSVPKKTGGERNISAPKADLARAQEWILVKILGGIPLHENAHGFVPGRSVKTNAAPHVGKKVVVNLDLKDFFPSVTFRRVKGLFHKGLGYPEPVAVVLALLCTEPPRAALELDGKVYHVALGDRVLPQGACTSPAITNLLCRNLDRRLTAMATKLGFAYTRYADDLTFSSDQTKVGKLLHIVREVVEGEGFVVNEDKTRVMRKGRAQEVTGVTVNAKLGLTRKERRRLRAILHNAKKHGLESQNRDG